MTTTVPAAALHPAGRCPGCKRIMVRTRWAQNPGNSPLPAGYVRFGSNGPCGTCALREWRAARQQLTAPAKRKAPHDERAAVNYALLPSSLDAYLAGRRRRLARANRRALASALSAGWKSL